MCSTNKAFHFRRNLRSIKQDRAREQAWRLCNQMIGGILADGEATIGLR